MYFLEFLSLGEAFATKISLALTPPFIVIQAQTP